MSGRWLKHFVRTAGILVLASMNVQGARKSQPADVTIYVNGNGAPPVSVDFEARATVTWMYERIGIRIAWRIDAPGMGTESGSPVTIQLRYAAESPKDVSPDAFAFARPFTGGADAITVMYRRIQMAASGPTQVQALLAHVLAHEIGHVLQGTDGHSQSGVMKAHWDGADYTAMAKRPLKFTPVDVEMMAKGLAAWKLQTAGEPSRQ